MATKDNEWKPSDKQATFLSLPYSIKEAAYAGGAGSGKTDLLLIYPLAHKFYEHSRFKQLFTRRTYPEIRDEIVPRSRHLYTPFGATLNQTTMTWTFPSGARVIMGHCETEQDVHRYDSTEINLFTPDEVTSFTEYQYLYIGFTRVRSSDPDLPSIIRCCGMPGNIGHCVRFGEVLTPNGWIDVKNITVGTPIYEVNDNLQLEESIVEQVHIHDYNGPLWQARTSNLFIECTPEHRVLRKKGRDFNYTLSAVKDLSGQANLRRTSSFDGTNELTFTLPTEAGNNQPNVLPYNLYAEFMGWFLSEGSVLSSGRDNLVSIAQSKPGNLLVIKSLLDCCGFHYSIDNKGINFYSLGWWTYLYQFGKSRDKFIPRDLLNSSKETLRYLFIALMGGDGHWVKDGVSGQYYTISKQLCDDFCELAFKLGYLTYFKSRQRENRSYEIFFKSNETTEILTGNHLNDVETSVKRKSNVSYENYNGLVYDIGVPKYHTFVIRQNGYVWISGNSWFKKRFVDPCPSGGKIIIGRGGIKRLYIHSTLLDNPGIDPEYKRSLMALPDAERKAKLEGDWDAFQGSVFDEFRSVKYPDEPENALHVIEPFDIPDWWPKILVGDWGFRAMTWFGFGAISPDKRLYIYRELAWKQTKISDWAAILRTFVDKESPRIIRVCKSAGQDRGQEHTIQQQIEDALGHPIELSNNTPGSRVAGKMLIHEYLRWKSRVREVNSIEKFDEDYAGWILRNQGMRAYNSYLESFRPPKPETNLPKMQIFNTCPLLIDTIHAAVYNPKRVEDIQEFDGDDPLDGLRYLVDTADTFFEDASNEFDRIQRQEELIRRMSAENDWTAFYRGMEKLERKDIIQPVSRYHHVKRDSL